MGITTERATRLCIGCWFQECGGDHPDPDYDCPCCTGYVEVVR